VPYLGKQAVGLLALLVQFSQLVVILAEKLLGRMPLDSVHLRSKCTFTFNLQALGCIQERENDKGWMQEHHAQSQAQCVRELVGT
jgi:hypothetical protein